MGIVRVVRCASDTAEAARRNISFDAHDGRVDETNFGAAPSDPGIRIRGSEVPHCQTQLAVLDFTNAFEGNPTLGITYLPLCRVKPLVVEVIVQSSCQELLTEVGGAD